MRFSTEHLARASANQPKKTILIWLVALIVAFVAVGSFVEGTMTTEFFFYGNPESKRADTLLEERLRGPADVNEVIIVRSADMLLESGIVDRQVGGPSWPDRGVWWKPGGVHRQLLPDG